MDARQNQYIEDIENEFPARPIVSRVCDRDRQIVRKLATRYVLCGEQLYKRSFNHVLLRCLPYHVRGGSPASDA